MLVARRVNYDPSIVAGGPIDAVRTSEWRAGVASARGYRPVGGVFVVRGRDELNSGFCLRDVDITSFASARLPMQRGEDTRHDESRRHAVGPRTKRAPR